MNTYDRDMLLLKLGYNWKVNPLPKLKRDNWKLSQILWSSWLGKWLHCTSYVNWICHSDLPLKKRHKELKNFFPLPSPLDSRQSIPTTLYTYMYWKWCEEVLDWKHNLVFPPYPKLILKWKQITFLKSWFSHSWPEKHLKITSELKQEN